MDQWNRRNRDVALCKAGLAAAIESCLLFLARLMLFFYAQPGLGGLGPCEMLRKELASTRVHYYLGRETDLDLLEPVALALLRKKLETLVEKRSPLDCAVVLYRVWRNSKKLELDPTTH